MPLGLGYAGGLVGQCQNGAQHAVDDQVRITANRRREMRIRLVCETEMTRVLGTVNRLPQRAQHHRLQQLLVGPFTDARQQGISPEEALARANARIPLGRIAQPNEIADAVLFLASARASYVTAAILAMDGALTPMV